MFSRCLLAVLFAALPMTLRASMITIAPSYVQSFDSSMGSLGSLPNNGAATPVDGYMQFEFRISLADLAADEDFWTAAFNINLGPGLTDSSGWMSPALAQVNNYYPASPSLAQFDSNGALPGGVEMHWQYSNDDFGASSTDLQSIIVEAASAEAANRQYGEAVRPAAGSPDGLGSPTLIGSIIVQRTALVPSTITVAPIAGQPWGTYVGNSTGDGVPTAHSAASFIGESVAVPAPEPATFWLAASAFMAVAVAGRRYCRAGHRPRVEDHAR